MIKRTLYFGNPAYLKTRDEQLVIVLPDGGSGLLEKDRSTIIPIEDIGIVILDHQQITITQLVIAKLLANNIALITCNASHHPTGLMLNLDGNTVQSARFAHQIEASAPLKKQLWAYTIECKIYNQAQVLMLQQKQAHVTLLHMSKQVRSGDPENMEGRAAAIYWKEIFSDADFLRDREGTAPNNLLNYGYAILRAVTARAIVGSGLLPTLGIHHRNKYNAYCLADDLMEPYRPYIDLLVLQLHNAGITELTKESKQELLQIPTIDVRIENETSPLMIALQRSSAGLVKCFEGTSRKIPYPIM